MGSQTSFAALPALQHEMKRTYGKHGFAPGIMTVAVTPEAGAAGYPIPACHCKLIVVP